MGIDVREGASRISQLLQPEQPSDSELEPEMAEQSETIEDDSSYAEDSEHQEQAEHQDEQGETPSGDTEPSETRYKVQANGEEREVTIDDLKKGYMMESDYRKKTTEVARHRDEVKAKEDALTAKLQDAEAILALQFEDLNSEEMLDLKEYDRKAYEDKKEALEAKAKRLHTLKQEQIKTMQERKGESISKEKELLLAALPEWLDEATLTSESKMLNGLWESMNFTEEDYNLITNHKLILISRKAALYDKLKAAKPESKKVQHKPKSAKPGSATNPQDRNNAKTMDARQKLKQTGNMRDAQAAIRSLMR